MLDGMDEVAESPEVPSSNMDHQLPLPLSHCAPFDIKTKNGMLRVQPGEKRAYIFLIVSDDQNLDDLLEASSFGSFFRAVPQQTHFVFGAQADSMDKLQTIQEQMQRTSGYEEVKGQLHFMTEAIQPRCHLKREICQKQYYDNLVFQAVNEWGGEEPLMQISWSENGKLHTKKVEAKGDTGWLPSIRELLQEQTDPLEFANWGGLACDDSDNPQESVQGKIAVVRRGKCAFFEKVRLAQNHGASAVVIVNSEDGDMVSLSCGSPDPCKSAGLKIPAVMMSHEAGGEVLNLLKKRVTVTNRFSLKNAIQHFVGLDHFSRLREIGQIPPRGAEESFALTFLALEGEYYAYERNLEQKLSQPNALIVPVLEQSKQKESGILFSGGSGLYSVVELPDEATMKDFDKLEVYASLDCPGGADKDCGEWDYVVQLLLCKANEKTLSQTSWGKATSVGSCDFEMGRFVTPYSRPGKWMIDATATLPLLMGGGRHYFLLKQPYWSQQKYLADVRFVFSSSGIHEQPLLSIPLFHGGIFDQEYNSRHRPMNIDIPYLTSRAEIHSVITGHGWGEDNENCAEFCVTQHRFSLRQGVEIDGETYASSDEHVYETSLDGAGSEMGCARKVSEGVTPNQYGTWQFGRAGWCPGSAVSPWVVDVTSSVKPGLQAIITYSGLFNNSQYDPAACVGDDCVDQGFPAEIRMRSYLVIYGKKQGSLQAPAAARASRSKLRAMERMQVSSSERGVWSGAGMAGSLSFCFMILLGMISLHLYQRRAVRQGYNKINSSV
ncbi:hypothetical protein GUITHDRAFT_109061 [Guillardia theta CCMP2712]|uniref:Peptide-N-glycosidase F N-terminal domain-containing protein n=1 Tax=Guillardia theta (strain CCMP2712) TaxID=905079 RepID=L1J9L1_GUITC|nr:hypothetical protein GUITHDRAFT_109061 [Guillardia theta CCMP2712]EKX45017.1 hypothetical protein GUITHDRAFT_109061 [Guillardia theta CCMP2712]|eukprot:XP_005831997.1 hypothetical protein GUITHDRAFT_109061 [Guillardia theta CCMP2712]